MTGIFTNVKYMMEDDRYPKETRRHHGKLTRGELSIYSFGVDSWFFGYDGKLWRVTTCPGWILEKTKMLPASKLERVNPIVVRLNIVHTYDVHTGRWNKKEFRYLSDICDGWKDRLSDFLHSGRLENVHHVLIRLQRWTKRVLRLRKIRLALLMSLHPRLGQHCALGELGHDILLGVIVPLAFRVD
jgi:hypothetical protein